MKTNPTSRQAAGERGSAMILVLALLVIMTALVASNSLALNHLRQQLRLLDQQQQRSWAPAKPPHSPP